MNQTALNIPDAYKVRPGGGATFEPGSYPVEIVTVHNAVSRFPWDDGSEKREYRAKFAGVNEDGEDAAITVYITQAGYQVADPAPGRNKSGITVFLDNLFGRKLSRKEVQELCFFAFEGVKGKLLVSLGQNGQPKVEMFTPTKGTTLNPTDFVWTPELLARAEQRDAEVEEQKARYAEMDANQASTNTFNNPPASQRPTVPNNNQRPGNVARPQPVAAQNNGDFDDPFAEKN